MGFRVVEIRAETQTTRRGARDPARVELEDESAPFLTWHLDGANPSAELRCAWRQKRQPGLMKALLER